MQALQCFSKGTNTSCSRRLIAPERVIRCFSVFHWSYLFNIISFAFLFSMDTVVWQIGRIRPWQVIEVNHLSADSQFTIYYVLQIVKDVYNAGSLRGSEIKVMTHKCVPFCSYIFIILYIPCFPFKSKLFFSYSPNIFWLFSFKV